jgi:hypothetical protein
VEAAVSLTLTLAQPTHPVRLVDNAVAVPALSSHLRPALVLTADDARKLLQAADAHGVHNGGTFLAGPLGIQVWSGPFDSLGGAPGAAHHLGSVDWTFDTPVKHYATAYRSMVTAAGLTAGESTASILARVLALGGLAIPSGSLTAAIPPPRDPFRRNRA